MRRSVSCDLPHEIAGSTPDTPPPIHGAMLEGVPEDALRGKRRVASHATDFDYVPFARSMLWKLGYAVLPPEELAAPEARIVCESRLAEVAALPPLPLILLTDRRPPEGGDARVHGSVRRPAGVHPLYQLLQTALEEHPRGVPRVEVSLPARATAGPRAVDVIVPDVTRISRASRARYDSIGP